MSLPRTAHVVAPCAVDPTSFQPANGHAQSIAKDRIDLEKHNVLEDSARLRRDRKTCRPVVSRHTAGGSAAIEKVSLESLTTFPGPALCFTAQGGAVIAGEAPMPQCSVRSIRQRIAQRPSCHVSKGPESFPSIDIAVDNNYALEKGAHFHSRFKATQPMRVPQATSMPSSSNNTWDQTTDLLAHVDADGRSPLMSGGSASSPSGGASNNQTDKQLPRGGESDEHPPDYIDDRSDKQSPQPPDENMDQAPDDDPPQESEPEEDPESESEELIDYEEPEEEHIPLTYQIPPDVLENAFNAPPQTRASYWSQKMYRGPDNEELRVYYCVNMKVAEQVAKHFLDEKVVGFDIEWKPFGPVDSIKENASLIQLAAEDRIALFHIARFPGKTPEELMPPTLKAVLECQDILKVGVAVKGDCTRLEKYFGMNIRGVFELSRLHNLVEYYTTHPHKVNHRLVNLAAQVQRHLLLPLHKGEPFADEPEQPFGSVRESDWSRPLRHDQIHYAAADAYAGLRLFDVMESKRKKLKPTPPLPRLCDYDIKPASRTTSKAERAKKLTPELQKIVAESLSGLDADDLEEEAYETAAEEQSVQEDEDADSESASEFSNGDEDADYIPKSRARISTPSWTARGDVTYPTLPSACAEGEDSSDESEAFDPQPMLSRRQRVSKPAQKADTPSSRKEESEDEFPDPELEEAFAAMDISDLSPSKNLVVETKSADNEKPTKTGADDETSSQPNESAPTFNTLIQSDATEHTREYALATTWAQAYLTSTIPSPSSTAPSRIRATVPPLRAYHMWHHQHVPLDAIGAHLRDPPLAQSTVTNYILQAISAEKLEYRDADLVALMWTLPVNLRFTRYGWLSRKLGIH